MMESALYKSIFERGEKRGEERGEARGEVRGAVRARASMIYKLLVRWLGSVDGLVLQHMNRFTDETILETWSDEALEINDADSAGKLLVKIIQTPAPPSEGASQAA